LKTWALSPDDIDYFPPHQANGASSNSPAPGLGQTVDKFPTNIQNDGNISSVQPLLLSQMLEKASQGPARGFFVRRRAGLTTARRDDLGITPHR
jgi:3-oxoacyl-[acyl-carrier-protein] synthase III